MKVTLGFSVLFSKFLVSVNNCCRGFPGGSVVKNKQFANAGDTGSIPGLGRSYMPWSK